MRRAPLALIGLIYIACASERTPRTVEKRPPRPAHAEHAHPHLHPHESGGHHHHPHPHPHLEGQDGHHHPY